MKVSQLIGHARFEHFGAQHRKDTTIPPGLRGVQYCRECGCLWPCDARVLLDAIAVAETVEVEA